MGRGQPRQRASGADVWVAAELHGFVPAQAGAQRRGCGCCQVNMRPTALCRAPLHSFMRCPWHPKERPGLPVCPGPLGREVKEGCHTSWRPLGSAANTFTPMHCTQALRTPWASLVAAKRSHMTATAWRRGRPEPGPSDKQAPVASRELWLTCAKPLRLCPAMRRWVAAVGLSLSCRWGDAAGRRSPCSACSCSDCPRSSKWAGADQCGHTECTCVLPRCRCGRACACLRPSCWSKRGEGFMQGACPECGAA